MRAFLARSGWGRAHLTPLPGDASTRHYLRATANGRKAMLMDQPQGAETPPRRPTPARKSAGRSATTRSRVWPVRIAARFVAVADYLRKRGLSAPEIYCGRSAQGFVLMEDLGNDLYADV